ncbi:MAG: hypothetical protein EKK53_00485 [Burkholderiales bacterium]|nr:MAG: hypothetical protein EKK53_00485 [Burkholderiales bacterium]
MLPPVSSVPNTAAAPSAAPVVARPPEARDASVVVTVSRGGQRAAASQDAAKIATGIVHATADLNHDGTVSDQEQQTEDAQLTLKKALMEGSPNLEEALQAYQTIAAMADAQR